MIELITRSYNGTPIQLRPADGYVNATAMCKACGKQWADYFRTDRATKYLEALSTDMGNPVTGQNGLVISIQGGPTQGTWVHERVAVDLARWLSPQFAVFMDGWFTEEVKKRTRTGEWIVVRGKQKDNRKQLCDELHKREVTGGGIAQITNMAYLAMWGKTAAAKKRELGVHPKHGNLRNELSQEENEDIFVHEIMLKRQVVLQDERGDVAHKYMAKNIADKTQFMLHNSIDNHHFDPVLDTPQAPRAVFKANKSGQLELLK